MKYELNSHVNTISLSSDGSFLVSGNRYGFLLLHDPKNLSHVYCHKKASNGTVQVIQELKKNYFACLCKDRSLIVFHVTNFEIFIVDKHTLYFGEEDGYMPIHNVSQVLATNSESRISTLTASGKLIEFSFVNDKLEIINTFRPDEGVIAITILYINDGLLVGFNKGKIKFFKGSEITDLSPKGIDETIHLFVEYDKNKCIVANDSRAPITIDLEKKECKTHDKISLDDLENVVFSKKNNFFLFSSFDRNIYKVENNELLNSEVYISLEYKLRWQCVHDDNYYVQIRNGSIKHYSLTNKKLISSFSNSVPCIWSSVEKDGTVIFAGESNYLCGLNLCEMRYLNDINNFGKNKDSYFKRIIAVNEIFYLVTSDGTVFSSAGKSLKVSNFAIRDICGSHDEKIFIVTEGGELILVGKALDSYQIIFKKKTPLWSVSINNERNILSFSERVGKTYLYDINTKKIIDEADSFLPKRSKWIDNNRLLVSRRDTIDMIIFSDDGEIIMMESFIDGHGNTIEDFICLNGKYILSVFYNKRLALSDLSTGDIIDSVYTGVDYMKSIICQGDKIITAGRSNNINIYEVHDDQILPIDVLYRS